MREVSLFTLVCFALGLLMATPGFSFASDETGSIKITTTPPGAKVYLEDRHVENTPCVLSELPALTYKLKIYLDDNHIYYEQNITVEAGKMIEINYNFEYTPQYKAYLEQERIKEEQEREQKERERKQKEEAIRSKILAANRDDIEQRDIFLTLTLISLGVAAIGGIIWLIDGESETSRTLFGGGTLCFVVGGIITLVYNGKVVKRRYYYMTGPFEEPRSIGIGINFNLDFED